MTESLKQGSEEWLRARAGHCTASRFADVLARLRSGEEASGRRNYRTQLVTERLTGLPVDSYKNQAMQWGTDHEAEARKAIEVELGLIVRETGFHRHPTIPWVGCSPDGLIDDDGVAQIKCPYVSTVHVETLQNGMPSEHIPQIQGELWVTGRKWSLFVSYDPRMPEHLRLYTQRIERDDVYIKRLEKEIRAFLDEVEVLYRKLLKKEAA